MQQATAFYFGTQVRPLFGWLHTASDGSHGNLGLVICNPLGYEAISSHRTNRHMAIAAAARGIPVLRFDYDGTGDSAGDDTEPDRVKAWLQSIQLAIETLREATGVTHVCLAGIRLGASLALLATQNRDDVCGVIAINPVIDGRRYLREMRALAATGAQPVAANSSSNNADVQEAAGFITTAATRETLAQIQLARDSLQTAPSRILLLERADLPTDDTLATHLTQLGSDVGRLPFSGYADMLRDPHETVVPDAMIGTVVDWLVASSHATSSMVSTTETLRTQCRFAWSSQGTTAELQEWAIRICPGQNVFGIVTSAAAPAAGQDQPTLLLLNSGAVHHVGPNRLYVQIARHCALLGMTVVRLDLPGLGDSPAENGKDENIVYPPAPHEIVGQAMELAREQLHAGKIYCAGICSGGYHSLKAAVAGLPLNGIVVINPLTFFWKPHLSLAPPAFQDTAEMMRYQQAGFQLRSWKKLLTGKVNLRGLAARLIRHFSRRIIHKARNLARSVGIRPGDDLASELRSVSTQGTRMHFVFSRTDPGYPMLMEQAGSEVQRLRNANALTIDFLADADHTFTPFAAQAALQLLLAELITAGRRVPGSA
jgi:pimeloyl-ACP methyl ester carboxylesterase